MLPDGRGVVFLRALRVRSDVPPVIIPSALERISDRIEGLTAGADDDLLKPFDLAGLPARIGSVARRHSGNPDPIIRHGDLDFDLAARSLHNAGPPVQLTARDWALSGAFLSPPGHLLSRSQLEKKLHAFGSGIGSNTIDVHVSRLRKKPGPRLIETERSFAALPQRNSARRAPGSWRRRTASSPRPPTSGRWRAPWWRTSRAVPGQRDRLP